MGKSKITKKLPNEIIDEILLMSDMELCIAFNRMHVFKKLAYFANIFVSCSYEHVLNTCKYGRLDMIKYLYDNAIIFTHLHILNGSVIILVIFLFEYNITKINIKIICL